MATKYISIRVVMDKLLRHPMLQGLSLEATVDYAIDFMRIVGCPAIFTEKTVFIEIENYKGLLPDDFYDIIQVRSNSRTFRYSTNSFHMSEDKSFYDLNPTYKIQGDYIFTSLKEGEIEIAYTAIETDDCGFPMIPDNSKFIRALEAYIKKQWFTILFDLGKIQHPQLQVIQQEYAWAVGACESEFQKLSLDKAESFFNSWRTMLTSTNQHQTGFIDIGARQHFKYD